MPQPERPEVTRVSTSFGIDSRGRPSGDTCLFHGHPPELSSGDGDTGAYSPCERISERLNCNLDLCAGEAEVRAARRGGVRVVKTEIGGKPRGPSLYLEREIDLALRETAYGGP